MEKENYDLIITDIQMPGISGLDLLKRIKTHKKKSISKTPVLAVTANVIKESIGAFKNSGFTEVLIKPFKEVQLALAILKATGIVIPESFQASKEHNLPIAATDQNIFSGFMEFSGGDKQAAQNMLGVFIRNCTQQLEYLNTCFDKKKWEKLKMTAHRLIPGFGHVQNYEIMQLLEVLEHYLDKQASIDEKKVNQMVKLILEKGFEQIKILEDENASSLNL